MNSSKFIVRTSQAFILVSALSLASVSYMAWTDPRSVMALVNVKLDNPDALSSIRGVYGGAGSAMVIALIFLLRRNAAYALGFLTMLWGFYAIARVSTLVLEGSLGSFGRQWMLIETVLAIAAATLSVLYARRGGRSIPVPEPGRLPA
jgi:hypothetical protein